MIHTPGEKIRKLRSEFGLNQWDIVNSEVSRNFISMIENDKSALTPRVAEIIISMLDAYCLSNGLTHDYTVAYLLEDVETQVVSAAENYTQTVQRTIDEKGTLSEASMEEIDFFIATYQRYDLLGLILLLAEYYELRKAYLEGYTLTLSAFSTQKREIKDKAYQSLILKLIAFCIQLEYYEESFKYVQFILKYTYMLTSNAEYVFKYNKALILLNLGRDTESSWLCEEMLKSKEITPSRRFNVRTILGLSKLKSGLLFEAQEIFRKLIRAADALGPFYTNMTLANLLKVAIAKADHEEMKTLSEQCRLSIKSIPYEELSQGVKETYIDLMTVSIELENFETALEDFQRGFEFCLNRGLYNASVRLFQLMERLYLIKHDQNVLSIYGEAVITLFKTAKKHDFAVLYAQTLLFLSEEKQNKWIKQLVHAYSAYVKRAY